MNGSQDKQLKSGLITGQEGIEMGATGPEGGKKKAKPRKTGLKGNLEVVRKFAITRWESSVGLGWHFYTHLVITVVLLILTFFTFYWNSNTFSLSWRYDKYCEDLLDQNCVMKILIPRDVPKGSILYLELTGFMQSQRIVMKSWSTDQMRGMNVTIESQKDYCNPDITNSEMEKLWALDGTKLNPAALSRPCGLLAKHFPKDTFKFFNKDTGKTIELSNQNIAWPGLIGTKFNSVNRSEEWVNIEDERFINWMRPNTAKNVYKNWGRFEEDLEAGEYTVTIFNSLDPALFGGQKIFGICNLGPNGARNLYVPMVLAVICLCSLVFTYMFYLLMRAVESVPSRK